jgi:hypothetical protein
MEEFSYACKCEAGIHYRFVSDAEYGEDIALLFRYFVSNRGVSSLKSLPDSRLMGFESTITSAAGGRANMDIRTTFLGIRRSRKFVSSIAFKMLPLTSGLSYDL